MKIVIASSSKVDCLYNELPVAHNTISFVGLLMLVRTMIHVRLRMKMMGIRCRDYSVKLLFDTKNTVTSVML